MKNINCCITQKDFIDGALGTKEVVTQFKNVKNKIAEHKSRG